MVAARRFLSPVSIFSENKNNLGDQNLRFLCNRLNRAELLARLDAETFQRKTLSFYRYIHLDDVRNLRDQLFREWYQLGILGRVYLASEGYNAQVSVPEPQLGNFFSWLETNELFQNLRINTAIEDSSRSFLKLVVKVKKKIVADGLDDFSFDVSNVGQHVSAEEFNRLLDDPQTIAVDMRNSYETEVGHFERAILPQAETFREELPLILDLLKDKKDRKVLLYCTGGVRCEKASAWLRHHGFKNVYQLYGGIIHYANEIKQKGLTSKFRGKNFVFDERLAERVSDEIIARCHFCQTPCDRHLNCANDACHKLMIQCEACREKLSSCCSAECAQIIALPLSQQKKAKKEFLERRGYDYHRAVRPMEG